MRKGPAAAETQHSTTISNPKAFVFRFSGSEGSLAHLQSFELNQNQSQVPTSMKLAELLSAGAKLVTLEFEVQTAASEPQFTCGAGDVAAMFPQGF